MDVKGSFKTGENPVYFKYLMLACFFMHSPFGFRDPISIKKAFLGVHSNLLLHVPIQPKNPDGKRGFHHYHPYETNGAHSILRRWNYLVKGADLE